jgi:uncharacterized damage-inducible protein DinB
MNAQLLACCRNLPDDKLAEDTKTFFPSIISYWNHLMFGDLIMMNRLASNEIGSLTVADLAIFPKPVSTQDTYFDNLSDIGNARHNIDTLIFEWCSTLTAKDCEQILTYRTTEGHKLSRRASDIIQHMFNHETHHRGQLTCILSLNNVDYGCTDLPVIVPEGSQA